MSALARTSLALAIAASAVAQDLPPFEAALYAMTDARRLNPCAYNPNADNSAVLTDPAYDTFNNRRSYNNGITFRRFELFLERTDSDKARCFLDLIKAKLTGSAPGPSRPAAPVPVKATPAPPQMQGKQARAANQSPPAPAPATDIVPVPAPAAQPRIAPELQSRYDAILSRTSQTKAELAGFEARMAAQKLRLRPDISEARTRLDTLLGNAAEALRNGDEGAVEENLRYAEGTLSMIDKFLGK